MVAVVAAAAAFATVATVAAVAVAVAVSASVAVSATVAVVANVAVVVEFDDYKGYRSLCWPYHLLNNFFSLNRFFCIHSAK